VLAAGSLRVERNRRGRIEHSGIRARYVRGGCGVGWNRAVR
jgi:hypothetical protein